MFNLDRLFEVRPEVMPGLTWDKELIPESPDSFIESLVQRVNKGRFRFELGDYYTGPRLSRAQTRNYELDRSRDNRKQAANE